MLRRCVGWWFAAFLAVGCLSGLTAAERVQLATADDRRPPDEPALYPLLRDAVRSAAVLPPQGRDPDFAAIMDDPAAFRGERLEVRGQYAGRSRRVTLRRTGAWGEAVTEWGVVVGAGSPGEAVAVVYLVDPDGGLATPRPGQRVVVAARFFKLWRDRDASGAARTYPVFVGSAEHVVIEARGVGARGPASGYAVLLAAVVAMLGVVFWLRRRVRRAASDRPVRRLGGVVSDDEESSLPGDPAEALAALQREAEHDAETTPRV
ncbi:MAG: hypothetical protein AAF710_06565 [Planctomycetota bacterium]